MNNTLTCILVFLSPAFLDIVTGLHSTTCPDGWLPFDGSCYLFGHDAVHFTEAEHFCTQHHNSHLIQVHSKLENDFIKDHLGELAIKNWWLGITDEMIEGTWQWLGTDEIANFTDFYPGQSNSYSEDCGVFWAGFGFTWGDYPCLGICNPICELRGLSCEEAVIVG